VSFSLHKDRGQAPAANRGEEASPPSYLLRVYPPWGYVVIAQIRGVPPKVVWTLLAEPSLTEMSWLRTCHARPRTSGEFGNRPCKHFAGVVMRRRFQLLGPNAGGGVERGLSGCWSCDLVVVRRVAGTEVSGRTQTIAGCWTDLTSSLIGRTRSLQPKRPARSLPTRGFVDCCGGCTGIPFHLTYTDVPVGAWFMARFLDLLLALAAQRRLTSRAALQAASSRAAYAAFMLQVSVLLSLEIATRPFPWPPLVKRCWWGRLRSPPPLVWGGCWVKRTPLGKII
jgi:hypothetical protein